MEGNLLYPGGMGSARRNWTWRRFPTGASSREEAPVGNRRHVQFRLAEPIPPGYNKLPSIANLQGRATSQRFPR